MFKLSKLAGIVTAAVLALMWAAPAQAQASRTWISGVGDDANPCSRTAPCKTFPGAISKTATGGEINCLDPGGFGNVTITKSITLRCNFTEGGILGAGTNGVTINAAGGKVVLDGLDIDGFGTGLNGVSFLNGASLLIRNCLIRNFNASGSNGNGVNFAPSAAGSTLTVVDTVITNNGNDAGGSGNGVLIKPTGSGSVVATFDNVRLVNNTNGFNVTTTSTGSAKAIFTGGVINGGVVAVGASATSSGSSVINIDNSVIQNASLYGLFSVGANAQVGIARSQILGNGTNLFKPSGAIVTYGDNQQSGNGTTNSFTVTVPHV